MMEIEDIRELSVYELSRLADCGTPDHSRSAGAHFLDFVRNAYIDGDDSGQIASDAPDAMDNIRWAEFTDLAAWAEKPESGEWSLDLTDAAGQALTQIAERLLAALAAEPVRHVYRPYGE